MPLRRDSTRCCGISTWKSAAERRSRIPLNHTIKGEKNMRLRTSVILVALRLFAVASTASATMSWQPKQPKADAISGAWDAVLINDDNNVQVTLTLKLEGNKVAGSFESSHLGSGAIKNGSWANNKLTIGMETSH